MKPKVLFQRRVTNRQYWMIIAALHYLSHHLTDEVLEEIKTTLTNNGRFYPATAGEIETLAIKLEGATEE